MSEAPLLKVNNLGRDYRLRRRGLFSRPRTLVALDRVNFEVKAGEILGLAGESGCGKSTLARLLCRLEEPTRGEVVFSGDSLQRLNAKSLRKMRRRFQPVFQDPQGSLNPRFTLRRTLAEPLRLLGKAADAHGVLRLMELVGLGPELLERYPHQLSGGQKQRLGLARTLAMEPDLIVADEPLSSLDVSIQAQILNLILDLQARLHVALVFISHDLRVVGYLSDRVLIMYLGRIMEIAAVESLFRAPRHPYSRALFAALPRLQPGRGRQRAVLRGEPPTPVNPESGCRFYSRCLYREAPCREYDNELLPVETGHAVACRRWRDLPAAVPGK